jgi:hypothetical protein
MPKTPTFEEMFGVGTVPLSSYFNLPKGASADTRFSPDARALIGQGEDYAREQAARDAEIAAEELLGGAAEMSDEQIQQQLTQNPRMFGTQAIQPLSGFMQYRQSTTPVSDETLGPVLREQIKDPYHRERFQQRMLDEGLSATDAFDAYRTDEYNNKFEVQLAEAGVPETEYAKLKTPSGKFIPAAVARAKQTADLKAAEAKRALTRRTSDDPLDKKIDAYERAMKRREDVFKATGREAELAKDPIYTGYITEIEKATKAQLDTVNPPVIPINPANQPGADGVIKRVAPGAARPPVDIESNSDLLPEEKTALKNQISQQAEKAKAQAVIDNEIASAWSKQKSALQKDIEKQYSKKDLLAAAKGILRGALAPGATSLVEGEQAEDYLSYLLRKLGRGAGDPAFTEPQNKRWGTQVVTNSELLQAWAEQYAAENGGQKTSSVPTSDTSEPLTELIPP